MCNSSADARSMSDACATQSDFRAPLSHWRKRACSDPLISEIIPAASTKRASVAPAPTPPATAVSQSLVSHPRHSKKAKVPISTAPEKSPQEAAPIFPRAIPFRIICMLPIKSLPVTAISHEAAPSSTAFQVAPKTNTTASGVKTAIRSVAAAEAQPIRRVAVADLVAVVLAPSTNYQDPPSRRGSILVGERLSKLGRPLNHLKRPDTECIS